MITQETESRLDSIPTTSVVGFASVASEFESQIKSPPDGYIKNCYEATLNLLPKNSALNDIFSTIMVERPMTPQHFVNLYFRALQHIELTEKNNPNYPKELVDPNKWEAEITQIAEGHGDSLLDIMRHKSTQTTIYQRYAGPKFVISEIFGSLPVNIADFGCGGNYGLPGLSQNEPFNIVEDHTPEGKVTQKLNNNIRLEAGLAIDQEDPHAPGAREWLHSCSFYPSELSKLNGILEFEKRISHARNVTFLQKDIAMLTPKFLNGSIRRDTYDAVIFCTVLYQDPEAQEQAFENARSILKPTGVIIVQDFAIKDARNNKRLDFDREWHVPGNYRTFVTGETMDWQMKEVLKWDRARCKVVEPGDDFNLIGRR